MFNLPYLMGSPDSVKTFLCASDSARIAELAKVNCKEKGKDLRNVGGRIDRPW